MLPREQQNARGQAQLYIQSQRAIRNNTARWCQSHYSSFTCKGATSGLTASRLASLVVLIVDVKPLIHKLPFKGHRIL